MEHEHKTHTDTHNSHNHMEDGLKEVIKKNLIDPVYILLVAILAGAIIISASIFYTTKTFVSKINGTTFASAPNPSQNLGQGNNQAAVPTIPDSGFAKVSVDDDPIMGSNNAPLTIIEFSDYECPFCKRSFSDVIPGLKKDYIDTGKVKLIYRDFPLGFHQNAEKEAEAAECSRAQGGDTAYYKFHDQIFTKTTSNGTGLALDQLPVIAKDLGLNVNQFQQCLDSGKYKDEVAKDIADGTAAGVSGTPTWFIGKSNSNGVIDGARVVGAQPYTVFKTIIDQQLK